MTCTIIAALVTCVASGPTTPRPTAAEAARIFRTSATPFVFVAPLPKGPTVIWTSTTGPTQGPWARAPLSPRRRLDGTLLTDPPADAWSQPSILVVPFVDRPRRHFTPSTTRPR